MFDTEGKIAMSRGPGKWQRLILERLRTHEQFYLLEILPSPADQRTTWGRRRPHVQVAVLRAAHRLAAQGQITLDTRRTWSNYVYWTGKRWQRVGGVIVARPGVTIHRIPLQIQYEMKTRMQGRWPYMAKIQKSPQKVPTLRPFQLGAVASMVKLLVQQGHPTPTDTEVLARFVTIPLPVGVIQAALDQLRAEGHYQRLLDEARQS
jgi:hypothetical protein